MNINRLQCAIISIQKKAVDEIFENLVIIKL